MFQQLLLVCLLLSLTFSNAYDFQKKSLASPFTLSSSLVSSSSSLRGASQSSTEELKPEGEFLNGYLQQTLYSDISTCQIVSEKRYTALNVCNRSIFGNTFIKLLATKTNDNNNNGEEYSLYYQYYFDDKCSQPHGKLNFHEKIPELKCQSGSSYHYLPATIPIISSPVLSLMEGYDFMIASYHSKEACKSNLAGGGLTSKQIEEMKEDEDSFSMRNVFYRLNTCYTNEKDGDYLYTNCDNQTGQLTLKKFSSKDGSCTGSLLGSFVSKKANEDTCQYYSYSGPFAGYQNTKCLKI